MSTKGKFTASTAIGAVLLCAATAVSATAQDAGGENIETVVVLGVRGAEQKAIDLKRDAASIQDSISAEDIGKLPDVTIADSLQRITGVQIDRSAGEGDTVNIRGLPQVGTTLNGETFITAGSIVSAQPSFSDIPSQLFAGADVVKSPTAHQLNGGITGTIDLKTRRPFDLKEGWTASGSVDTAHGFVSKKWDPEVNALLGYNHGRWGMQISASYADVTLENSQDGMDYVGGIIIGENAASATEDTGFIGAWNGGTRPSRIAVLNAAGDVDVDGDGAANSAFYGSQDFTVYDEQVERKRFGFNASGQYDFGSGLKMTADFFYTGQQQFQRISGLMLESANYLGATFVPLVTRDTGVTATTDYNTGDTPLEFYTTQVYEKWVGAMETNAEDSVRKTASRNFNLQFDYDNGGNFTGSIRSVYANASELLMTEYINFTMSDGAVWNSQGGDYSGTTTYHYPASAGGDRTFNANGYAVNSIDAVIDTRGNHLKITLPDDVLSSMDSKSGWTLKTLNSSGNIDRKTDMLVLRADGQYKFGNSGLGLDGGFRFSRRTADNVDFNLVGPVYAGEGASSSAGCYVMYFAADVVLNGGGVDGSCTAGDSAGYYTANPYAYAMDSSSLPNAISKNIKHYTNIAGVKGISFYNLAPKAMDNVFKFQNSIFPGQVRNINPGATWKVAVNQFSGYLQGTADGELLLPYSLNVGVRVIHTDLTVTQHIVGDTQAYGLYSTDGGTTVTDRGFDDYLPTVNLSLDLRDDLKMRLAYSKNMQLLDLNEWGGGLTLNYGLNTSQAVYAVLNGTQDGSPDLDPWRSTNYDLSFEYYFGKASMINAALFYIDMDSWISSGNVTRCDLPDQDGVVRNRCVTISGPVQGRGKNLKGAEIGYKQAFDFLPGFWGNFGAELNFTYSPSNTGTDMAGHKIPFQDNSERQANMILWYQDKKFQGRIAGNYRSRRAVSADYGGISGMELYEMPALYLDASMSYDYNDYLQFYLQGTNILGEEQHFYFVWKDQLADHTRFEPRVTFGLRAKF